MYAGDTGYAGSTSPKVDVTPTPSTDTLSLTSSVDPSAPGQQVAFTTTVTPSGYTPPTGSVTFSDGSTSLGTATVNYQYQASVSATLAAGTHTITAVYSGDSVYPSTTATFTQSAVAPAAGLTVSSDPVTPTDAQVFTLTAVPTSPSGYPNPTGTVTVTEGTTTLGTASLSGGQAQLGIGPLAIGDHTITATYSGDTTYPGSTATITKKVITSGELSVGSSAAPSVPGQRVVLTATMGQDPYNLATGTITVLDGSTQIASGNLDSNQSFSFATSTLTNGDHHLTFEYAGDGTHQPRTVSFTQTVAPADPNRRYVNSLYNSILHRPADGAAAGYAAALDADTTTRGQVALALTMSTENITNEVQAVYEARLGRPADASGLTYWVNYIRNGGTIEDLEISFFGSHEYYVIAVTQYDYYATPAEDFVVKLYDDILNRYPDDNGELYWAGRVVGGTPTWVVAASLLESTEAMSNRVTAYYQEYLHRAPDTAGLNSWVKLLQSGTRDETLIADLLASTEYWNDIQAY